MYNPLLPVFHLSSKFAAPIRSLPGLRFHKNSVANLHYLTIFTGIKKAQAPKRPDPKTLYT